MAQTITINDTIPFVIGRHRDTRKAVIAQNALAEADMLAGTLLTPDSDGKLVPCVAEDSDNNVDATYPVAALIHDIPAEALVAGDVAADVVYNTMLNKAYVEEVNEHLEIDETFIWESVKNGIDIREMV